MVLIRAPILGHLNSADAYGHGRNLGLSGSSLTVERSTN